MRMRRERGIKRKMGAIDANLDKTDPNPAKNPEPLILSGQWTHQQAPFTAIHSVLVVWIRL
jgi:hypothetical protein